MRIVRTYRAFQARCQRFIRGYARRDARAVDLWFIETPEPLLRHLQQHYCGYPPMYTAEEWGERIGKMADLLHLMDEENIRNELFQGGLSADTSEIKKEKEINKTAFFKMFAYDLYDLWDQAGNAANFRAG